MPQSQEPLQRVRNIAGAAGLALFAAWCIMHFFYLSGSLEELSRLDPAEQAVRQQKADRLESTLLHFAIPMLVVGSEIWWPWIAEYFGKRKRDKVFQVKPHKRWKSPEKLPALITSDIDACITPPGREVVVLRNIH